MICIRHVGEITISAFHFIISLTYSEIKKETFSLTKYDLILYLPNCCSVIYILYVGREQLFWSTDCNNIEMFAMSLLILSTFYHQDINIKFLYTWNIMEGYISHHHSWFVHPHQCQPLWSSHPPLHQWASHLSWSLHV